jgi:hypothetical protein
MNEKEPADTSRSSTPTVIHTRDLDGNRVPRTIHVQVVTPEVPRRSPLKVQVVRPEVMRSEKKSKTKR